MIAASAQMLSLLSNSYRLPLVEVVVQYPSPLNPLFQGAQLMLDGITDISINRNEEPTSDALDFTIGNIDGRYSPLRGAGTYSLYS